MTPEQLKALQDYQDASQMTPEQRKALADAQAATTAFQGAAPAQYGVKGNLLPTQLGDSAMQGVSTDPALREHELAALRDLETQSHDGFTASDRAAMQQSENMANRANRGRIGAIQQSMAARGAGGSGMDMVAQMQSAQDANELEAMRALEREGAGQDRRAQATRDLGTMSAGMQGQDFAQQSAKAHAADQIKQFNAQNSNAAQQFNISNAQGVGNANTAAANAHQQAAFGAGMDMSHMGYNAATGAQDRQLGAATAGYNAATEDENRRLIAEENERKRKLAKNQAGGAMIGTVAGGIIGSVVPGAGTVAGAAAGGALGGAAGSYLSDKRAKSDIKPEHDASIEAFLATLEPKSYTYTGDAAPKHGVIAQDLERSAIGRDMVQTDATGLKHVSIPDAIGGLLASVAHLNKKIRK